MQSSGQFNKKLATIISEGHLWTLQLFGDHDPQSVSQYSILQLELLRREEHQSTSNFCARATIWFAIYCGGLIHCN